jgi:hypothetical protein
MSFHGGPTGVGDRLCAFLTCVGFDMARASATWNSTHGCEYAAARLGVTPGRQLRHGSAFLPVASARVRRKKTVKTVFFKFVQPSSGQLTGSGGGGNPYRPAGVAGHDAAALAPDVRRRTTSTGRHMSSSEWIVTHATDTYYVHPR